MRATRLCAALVCAISIGGFNHSSSASILDPLSFGSLGTLNLGAGNYTIDTSGGSPTIRDSLNNVLFTGVTTAQASAFNPFISVFAFHSITIGSGANIQVEGDNPLALLSHTSANLSGTISANGADGGDGGDGTGGAGGAGGGKGGNGGVGRGEDGEGPGGGEGGSTGLSARGHGAGYGGRGRFAFGGLDDSTLYGDLKLALEGGSGGGGTNANIFHAVGAGGGGGGGAIEIGAIDSIIGNGVTIEANGGLSGDGLAMLAAGGSGGGLRIHAPVISFEGLPSTVRANGGNTFSGGGRILFVTNTGDLLNPPGNLSVHPGNFGETGTITYCEFEEGNQPVPEPSSLVVFGGPLLIGGLALARRRRKERHSTHRATGR